MSAASSPSTAVHFGHILSIEVVSGGNNFGSFFKQISVSKIPQRPRSVPPPWNCIRSERSPLWAMTPLENIMVPPASLACLFCSGSLPGQEPDEGVTASADEAEWSCVGVRQRCLKDVPRCSRSLSEYRLHCRENKKLDQCVTSDW